MHESPAYDAGHFSFLELIKVIADIAGPAFMQGALVKTGIGAAKDVDGSDFDTLEDYLVSVEEVRNPISMFEGRAKHYGDGIFGLPSCPFAKSIKTYTSVVGGLPKQYSDVTDRLNKQSEISDKLRVGEGAAVSPFCGVHQTIRSAFGCKIHVAGHQLLVYQLGCKSGSGKKGLARARIAELELSEETVNKILDDNMCCYCIRFDI